MLKEREEKIAKGVADADAAAKALAEAAEEKRGIIAAANTEAVAMADRAKAHASEKADAIVAEAAAKAAQVAKDAELRAAEAKAQAIKESEAEIAKLAILAAEKVLTQRAS